MKIRNPWLIRLVAFLSALVLRIWLSTLRVRLATPDSCEHPADPTVQRYIYALWHESLLVPACFRTGVNVLISHHADGEMIARVCHYLGIGVVRGSTTRGGVAGLMELIRGITLRRAGVLLLSGGHASSTLITRRRVGFAGRL